MPILTLSTAERLKNLREVAEAHNSLYGYEETYAATATPDVVLALYAEFDTVKNACTKAEAELKTIRDSLRAWHDAQAELDRLTEEVAQLEVQELSTWTIAAACDRSSPESVTWRKVHDLLEGAQRRLSMAVERYNLAHTALLAEVKS